MPFLFVFFFWDNYDLNVEVLTIVPEVSEIVLISLCFFSFFLSASLISNILSSISFILSYASVFLLLVVSRVFFFLMSVIALFIIERLFFISSRSLLNISCILSILFVVYLPVTPFCFQDFGSSLLSLFEILYQVNSLLFGLVGIYHVPLSAEHFSAFSFCLHCCIWGALSVGWKFVIPLYYRACSLWVGLD